MTATLPPFTDRACDVIECGEAATATLSHPTAGHTFRCDEHRLIACPNCGSTDDWHADYEQGVHQGVTLFGAPADPEVEDYDGCESTYDTPGDNTRYWCGNCNYTLWEEPPPVVICTRDPDASNGFEVFGRNVEIHDIDFGYADLRDLEEFCDWEESHLQSAEQYEQRGRADAGARIREIVAQARINYGHADVFERDGARWVVTSGDLLGPFAEHAQLFAALVEHYR